MNKIIKLLPFTDSIVHDTVVKVYLINLDNRSDRLLSAESQLNRLGMPFERISAIPFTELSNRSELFVTEAVAAIWMSHVKAMKAFLSSTAEYALILEDDFVFSKNFLKILNLNSHQNIDFLQIGFLQESLLDSFTVRVNNLKSSFFRYLGNLDKFPFVNTLSINSKVRVQEQLGASKYTVPADIQAGAHAYIVSRDFASAVIEMNSPVVFSTDAFYMTLGIMRTFKMRRLKKSCVNQSNSFSSVDFRFRSFNKFDTNLDR